PGSSGLQIALAKANSEKPYLGDPRVIDALVRHFVAGACWRVGAAADGEITREEAVAEDKIALLSLADILAGRNDAYETIGDWNPCGLTAYIRKQLGDRIAAEHAEDNLRVIQQACALMLLNVYAALDLHGKLGDEASTMSGLEFWVSYFSGLFLGLPLDDDSEGDPSAEKNQGEPPPYPVGGEDRAG
ncbi:MAG: hypothetical protein ACTHKH_06475, partial [Trinickia sp.]